MREDRIAFLLLFCGMVVVKRRRTSLAETMSMLPLSGRGRLLAIEMDRTATLWQETDAADHASFDAFYTGDGPG